MAKDHMYHVLTDENGRFDIAKEGLSTLSDKALPDSVIETKRRERRIKRIDNRNLRGCVARR